MKTTMMVASLALCLAGCKKEDAKPAAPAAPAAAPGATDKIAEGAKQMGQGIAQGAKAAWEATKEGAQYVGEKVKAGAQYVGEKVAAGAKVVAKEASDSWITTKIKSKIGISRLFSVSVDTSEGKVKLSGKVKTQAERDEIGKLARETDGVKQVENNLAVVPDAPAPAPAPAAPAPAK